MLPDEYRHLEAIASILPDGNTSPVHPFVGLVINLNAVTRAHRDSKDDTMCLVLALGDFEGSDLCLYGPGDPPMARQVCSLSLRQYNPFEPALQRSTSIYCTTY